MSKEASPAAKQREEGEEEGGQVPFSFVERSGRIPAWVEDRWEGYPEHFRPFAEPI